MWDWLELSMEESSNLGLENLSFKDLYSLKQKWMLGLRGFQKNVLSSQVGQSLI